MTPFEIAMLATGAVVGAIGALAGIKLKGKAPPGGDRLRPPPLPPSGKVSGR